VIITRTVVYARQEQVLLYVVDIIWKLIACDFVTQEASSSEAGSTPEKKKRRISGAKSKVGRLLHSNPRVCLHS
jgi:hypothetical protein